MGKKKKIALIVSIILTILATISGVSSAVVLGKNNQHVHVYEEIVDVEYLKTAATCESGAIYYKACSCGEASEETFVYGEPLGHTYGEWIAEVPATAQNDGVKGHYHCSVCGDNFDNNNQKIEDVTIPKLEHTHTYDKEVATSEHLATHATCTKKAKYYKSCACGANGTQTFEYVGLGEHSFTNYVSDNNATCTQDGTKTATCDRDDCTETDTITDVGSKLGHSFTNYVSDNNATCTHDGTKTATCDRDDCTETDTITDEGSKLGHSFTNYVSDNNATCTHDGTKIATCDRDDCTETDTITDEGSKLEHSFTNYVSDNNATCTQDGTKTATCDRDDCTETDTITDVGSKLGHDYGEWVTNGNATHTKTCSRCTTEVENHTLTENCADTNNDHNCDGCGEKISTCEDTDKNHKCDTCGETLTTCADTDKNHKCDTCGATMGEHKAAESKHTCDYCNQTVTECIDNDKDHLCDVCGNKVSEHTGGTATCTKKAVCTTCGKEYGEFAEHSYGALVPANPATCSATGLKAHYQCSACNKYFDESKVETTLSELTIAVDSTAHSYGEWVKDEGANTHTKTCSHDNNHRVTDDCEDTDKDHKCDTCGATISEHTGGTATCVNKAVCDICHKEYGEVDTSNHDYKYQNNADGTHTITCGRAGCEHKQENVACSDVNGDKKCDYCGYDLSVSQGLEYRDNGDNTWSVAGIDNCEDTALVIPSTYRGKAVTAIGANAFKGSTSITSLSMGKRLTAINTSAFA